MRYVEEGCATLVTTDAIDRQILAILRRDGRAAVSDIARAVGLSSAPVSRRIERMERTGVIRGYTALIDDQQSGSLEAFTEVRLAGGIETGELGEIVRDVPEVQEFFTIAGDPDALVRMRVDDVDHLQRVVNALRRTGKLTGTKTLIVMHTWNRAHDPS
jgi:Lrp/AsnC family leucine-responsive transcriptional regulator